MNMSDVLSDAASCMRTFKLYLSTANCQAAYCLWPCLVGKNAYVYTHSV